MRTTVLYLTVLGCALAVPNGYYHQEYNYKTSASAYKNNELQHKTDDQGYYRKDGDLEGRVRPRVDANSEHSEYVNPNLRNSDYNTGVIGAANGDLSSYGHMRADVGSHGSHDLSEGLAHSDNLAGSRGYSDYASGSSYGSNSYGSSSHSYGTSSNLRLVTSRLQQELERDLQQAIQENRGYSQSSQLGVTELERDLRQNLTNRLNAELASKYGQQSVRGGLSYTISGGRLQSTANYDNRELQDLRRQLEDTLLNQLRTQYRQTAYNSQYSGYNSQQNLYHYSTTTSRPYYTTPYYRPSTTITPNYVGNYILPGHTYTPVANPESLTTIATRVQNQLDSRLNQLLEDVERRYFSSSSSYSLTNTDVVLERLRNELKNNVTYLLNEEVGRNYGQQIPRDGHMYTVGSRGETSSQYNYSIRDLENLRSQIENNLIQKLNRDFETHRTRWTQQYSQSSYSKPQYDVYSTPRYDVYSTPRYDVYSTPRYEYNPRPVGYSTPHYNTYDSDVEHLSTRPTSTHLVPLISNGGGGQYSHVAGSRQSEYEVRGSSSSGASMSQLQSQLQQDLSRQLKTAINRGHYGSYSTSGSYNPQSYQASLQQLTDELNRNLTRQLQEYSASGYYSAHGNFDQAQMASLRNQLQSDLMRQLQQGLQQSYSSSSSYSASSSSSNSNYRPVRGFDNYQSGQYRSGAVATMQGEDCVGDDPNAYNSHRMKRSYPPYRSRPIGLGYSGGYSNNRDYNYGYGGRHGETGRTYGRHQPQPVDEMDLTQQVEQNQQYAEVGQQVDDSDLTQQVEDIELGQQVDDSDLTQQVEDSRFGKVQLGSHGEQQVEVGQQIDDSDLTQQVEDSGFGKLQVGSHRQEQIELGQQVDDSDVTQQVEDVDFGRAPSVTHGTQQIELGQHVDDSDLTQQVDDSSFGKLQSGSHRQEQIELGQQIDDSDLTQQVEDVGFGRAPSAKYGTQQIELGQQVGESDLTQQVEDSGFGKLQSGSHRQEQIELGQQVDDSDLTQQVEDVGYGRAPSAQYGTQQIELGQQVDESDLTQQVVDSGLRRVPSGSQIRDQSEVGQQVDNSDLTQQVDDTGFGNGQLGSSSQQQIELGQEVEDSGFGHVNVGSQQSQQEIERGQQEDNSYLDRTQVGLTHNHRIHRVQQPDLTQQVEENTDGKLQLGSQGQQQFTHNQPKLNHLQVEVADKLEEELSKQLQEAIHSHQYDTSSSSSGDQSRSSYRRSYEQLFNELQSNLTKQLQHISSGAGRYGSGYSYTISNNFNDQQIAQIREKLQEDLKKQLQSGLTNSYSYSHSWSTIGSGGNNRQFGHRQFGYNQIDSSRQAHGYDLGNLEIGHFKDFNKEQVQIAQQLEEEFSKELKNAIRTTYYDNSNSGSRNIDSKILYQNLVNELERNLTKQLQILGANRNSYSYSYTFNNQQLNTLRKQLENDLKLQLQKEIASIDNHSSNNLSQQPIRPIESSSLIQQGGSDGKVDQQELTQQVVDNTARLENQQPIGQEQVDTDLTQQIDDGFGKLQFGTQQIEQQPGNPQQETVTEHLEDSEFTASQYGSRQEIEQQPIEQGQTNQIQHTRELDNIPKRLSVENHQLTPEQIDQYQHVDKAYYTPLQIPSANLENANRPVPRRPIDSNNFLQRERQEILNTDQINYNQNIQRPEKLPTLNQVVQQQQFSSPDDEKYNTELPSQVEPLNVPETDDLTQHQVDLNQQSIDSDLTTGKINENDEKTLTVGQNILPTSQTNNQLNPSISNQNLNEQVPLEQPGGQSFGVTGQGQFITQPQTLTEAENESHLLIQRLRESTRNRDQSSSGQGFNYVHYNRPVTYSQAVQYGSHGGKPYSGQPVQEVDSFSHEQESFALYLNQQQIQFAQRLENDLQKELQAAVSQHYKIYSSSGSTNSELYQTSYKQLSEELRINIIRKLEEAGHYGSTSFSVYASLTDSQKEKILKQLQADLTRQLQQSLQVSYGLQQQNAAHSFGYGGRYSSSSSSSSTGSSNYGSAHSHTYHHHYPNSYSGHYGLGQQRVDQIHYGQPGEAEQQSETASEFQPIELQHANTVHDVKPQIDSNYNIGVKGHGRRHPNTYIASQQSPSTALGSDIQQPIAVVPPAEPVPEPPRAGVAPSPAVEIVAPLPGDPTATEQINNQDLPWWKRFGNKVKQGAQNLKEKIVG